MRGDRVRRPLTEPAAVAVLEQLEALDENFDADRRDELVPEHGWRVDDHRTALPSEPPGPPVAGGSWELARSLLSSYEFADPSIVRAFYRSGAPLEGRTMLLEGRFTWMRFLLGVRVGGVGGGTRSVDRRPVRSWGWSYRTLEGHLEMGQMDYEVRKWTDTGEVDFRIHAVSKAATIPDPLVRLGFALFGRRVQRRFIRRALERMEALVRSRLAAPVGHHEPGAGSGASGHVRLDPATRGGPASPPRVPGE